MRLQRGRTGGHPARYEGENMRVKINVKQTTARAALIAARALIEDRENWMQGDHATDAGGGRNLFPFDPDAACFCVDGALIRALCGPQGRIDHYDELLDVLSASPVYRSAAHTLTEMVEELRQRRGKGVCGTHVQFNDHWLTKHEDVLYLMDEAIRRASVQYHVA